MTCARGKSRRARFLGEKMRRDQHQAAHAMVLHAAGIDRRNRRAVAVAEQQAALEADGGEHARQHFDRLFLHERGRAGHGAGRRPAIAGARINEHAGASRRRQSDRETIPTPLRCRGLRAASPRSAPHRAAARSCEYSSCSGGRSRKPESASVAAAYPYPLPRCRGERCERAERARVRGPLRDLSPADRPPHP